MQLDLPRAPESRPPRGPHPAPPVVHPPEAPPAPWRRGTPIFRRRRQTSAAAPTRPPASAAAALAPVTAAPCGPSPTLQHLRELVQHLRAQYGGRRGHGRTARTACRLG